MGNRAVIQFKGEPGVGVYLHWNGGPDSVTAFLRTMCARGWTRMDYAPARLCAVITELFDSTGEDSGSSVGVFPISQCDCDNLDNGLYVVGMTSSDESMTGDSFHITQHTRPEQPENKIYTYVVTPYSVRGIEEGDIESHTKIVVELDRLRQLRKDNQV